MSEVQIPFDVFFERDFTVKKKDLDSKGLLTCLKDYKFSTEEEI